MGELVEKYYNAIEALVELREFEGANLNKVLNHLNLKLAFLNEKETFEKDESIQQGTVDVSRSSTNKSFSRYPISKSR